MILSINYFKTPSAVLYKCQNISKWTKFQEKNSVSFMKTSKIYILPQLYPVCTFSATYIYRVKIFLVYFFHKFTEK